MKKFLCLLMVSIATATLLQGQPLFTYGNRQVTKQEFLTAFNKNPTVDAERRKALDEYLNLYINYKLKVQAAYDEKLNTQPSFELESKNYKRQMAENLVNEEAGIKTLVQQAFERSKKDIRAAHIFIETPAGSDTLKAAQQIQQAYKDVMAGKDFGATAALFSSDEGTKKSKGDLGYITAFTLQYAIENEIYGLRPGGFSKPYRSAFGYHIFKNMSERPAEGKRKIAQILVALPPNAGSAEKDMYLKKADSIYQLVTHGEAFEKAAAELSNDVRTAGNGGVLGEVAVGQFEPGYEAKIFDLKKIGDISKPIETSYGYHLLKLLEILPVNKDSSDMMAMATIKQQVEKDGRLALTKKNLQKTWLVKTQFKKALYNEGELWAFTDSAINQKTTKGFKNIKDSSVLFSFAKQKIYTAAWVQYARTAKLQGGSSYADIMKAFIDFSTAEYYTNHLEDYNKAMQLQAKEFNEANLLFAAMDKHVWGKAGEDVAGLKACYEQYKTKYQWAAGVSALVVTCSSKEMANEVAAKIKNAPKEWRSTTSIYGTGVMADSGRYELQQLPIKQPVENRAGFISLPEKNGTEDSYIFLYVTAAHPNQETRSFDDARGMVINDYQQTLEQQWLAGLKKKYPVKVNDGVWKTVK